MAKDPDTFPKPNDRKPTDWCCGIVFIGCLAVSGLLVAYAFIFGNTQRHTHGFDWDGRLCGVSPGVEDKKFLYFCGSMARQGSFPRTLNTQSTACVASCPTGTNQNISCLMKEFRNITELGYLRNGNLTFLSTLNLDITQTVTLQQSYPTEPFPDRDATAGYCVPVYSPNNTLRSLILEGPMRTRTRVSMAVGSFRHAWPMVLVAAVLAVGLGLLYLYMLKSYAGPLLLISLVTAAVLLLLLGFYFIIGLFMNPWDEEGSYQTMSPIFRTTYGFAGNIYSMIVGGLLLVLSASLAFTTYNSVENPDKIDASIGVIQAACDCIFTRGAGQFALLAQPLVGALVMMVLILLEIYGAFLITSLGDFDVGDIHFNDETVPGLRKEFVSAWWLKYALAFYAFTSVWVLEVCIGFSQFTISYAVCTWYFLETKSKPTTANSLPYMAAASGKYAKKVEGVRVYGVEGTHGERHGYVEKGPHGKVLVVPIGRRGPGAKDFMQVEQDWEKDMPCDACLKGFFVGLGFHLGSIAMGGLIVPITRPLRWISQGIKSVLNTGSSSQEDAQSGVFDDIEERPVLGIFSGGCGLLAGVLEHVFGGYGKMAYVDMVLSATDFWTAGRDSFNFVVQAGGVVAFLHGGTMLYEMIGTFCITVTCGGLAYILLTHISLFSHEDSAWYVSDPWIMTVLASFAAMLIAHGFMSLFNITADTLLYVFAWSRKYHLDKIKNYCPPSLQNLVGDEMDSAPVGSLEPQGNTTMTRFSHALSTYKGQATKLMTRTGTGGGGGAFTGPPPGANVGESNWLLSDPH